MKVGLLPPQANTVSIASPRHPISHLQVVTRPATPLFRPLFGATGDDFTSSKPGLIEFNRLLNQYDKALQAAQEALTPKRSGSFLKDLMENLQNNSKGKITLLPAQLQDFQQQLRAIPTSNLNSADKALLDLFSNHLQGELFMQEQGTLLKEAGLSRPSSLEDFPKFVRTLSSAPMTPGIRKMLYNKVLGPIQEILAKMGVGLFTGAEGKLDRTNFERWLRIYEEVPLSVETQGQIAQNHMQAIETAMRKIAAKIDPNRDYKQILKELNEENVPPEQLVGEYQRYIQKAYDFLKQQDVATLPATTEAPVTLEILKGLQKVAKAHYVPGFDIVGVNTSIPQSKYGVPTTALHEAMPGHRLQQMAMISELSEKTLSKNSLLARLLPLTAMSDSYLEGWATYTEKMMLELGYHQDPKQQLMTLNQMYRLTKSAWTVSQLMSGQLNKAQVIQMMTDAGTPRALAENSASNLLKAPTKAVAYFLGFIQILQLREQVKAQKGSQFSLKKFNDKLLSYGMMPLPSLARLAFNVDLKPLSAVTEEQLIRLYQLGT